jgi:hypothetical protein
VKGLLLDPSFQWVHGPRVPDAWELLREVGRVQLRRHGAGDRHGEEEQRRLRLPEIRRPLDDRKCNMIIIDHHCLCKFW